MSAALEEWVSHRQARGQYAFLRADAVRESGMTPEAAKKALQRLEKRGLVARAKDYFYVIVTPEYASSGGPPPPWFIDRLMSAMALPYYVGLLSAAALHGASHQQPQEFQVVTDRTVRLISVGRSRVRFFASKYVREVAVTSIKTPTGQMRVSTPETTAVDLVRFVNSAGYISNVATVLSELVPLLDPEKLVAALKVADDMASTQRLGYILDHVRAPHLSFAVHRWAAKHPLHRVPLSKGGPLAGDVDPRWHVVVDSPLEVDS